MKKVILARLQTIPVAGVHPNLVMSGMIVANEIAMEDGKVIIPVHVPEGFSGDLPAIQQAIEDKIKPLDGVDHVLVVLTSDKSDAAPASQTGKVAAAPAPATAPSTPTTIPRLKKRPTEAKGPDNRPEMEPIPGIKAILAVASGKGGVGKSTCSTNIALALSTLGFRVGLLDADIYGPSAPKLMGIHEQPRIEGDRVFPIEKYGIKVMSMGFFMEEENPVIWRGPMVVSALMQFTREVDWGGLDVLVLDMPPGTGDAQLTMAQQTPLTGAVIVSTPQDLALIDARKGLNMFKNVDVPIYGIIENMSTFICPHCGKPSDIFGHGGAEEDARRLGVPFLGAIPLHMDIRENSDAGTPVVVSQPDSTHTALYKKIALNVAARMFPETDDE
ncbi:Mrp/NBP35 family ATP-binding protein [Alisedimentitalea sp. MJ-SS2]|uniref:Mrp/NBP35 family ATP-binding protein n=1 Tax=Aliisedimentitalea sp. MJ-SS2 TaxID=3049795 RepID=UPI0029065F29|nr:Mrp/NBP35 family ATP-binding protein [Alisedimentitalea sp. MJ-SS2]MDU8926210.1 Mrp/NBP35 family ATP-binding protein [Alisedimentitalea sp. MJ-SS2]